MTTRMTIPSVQGYGFSDSKIARFIETLKKIQFSGQLEWTAPTDQSAPMDQRKWSFYFYRGHICYATGGMHPVRRWARNLATYCPEIQVNITQLQQDLRRIAPANFVFGWEYHLFCLWVEQQKLTQTQVSQAMQSIFSEVLIELSQVQTLTHRIQKLQLSPNLLTLIDEKEAIAQVEKLFQQLWKYNIEVSVLDQSPVIKSADRLQGSASTGTYQALTQLLDGEKTLRDLAIQLRQDVVQVARSLLPYIQTGLVELVSVPDLPGPIERGRVKRKERDDAAKPLIACVDDSLIVCWTLEKLLTSAGYRCIAINDGLRAITAILERKPDLILLDVFMPGTNGYEICRTLRKAPSLRHTPIVFLTGLDGVVDQVRARLAGASDFISKPVDAERVLSVVAKHLSGVRSSVRVP